MKFDEKYMLFDACSYCYGPAGSLSTVLDDLDNTIDIILIGEGSSLELLKEHPIIKRVIEINTEDLYQLETIKDLLLNAALVVTNMNPVLAVYAKSLGVLTVFIDILPWMDASVDSRVNLVGSLYNNKKFMEKLPDAYKYYENIDLNLMQNYLQDFKIDSSIKNYEVIPPLLDDFVFEGLREDCVTNRLLICTGGLINPDGDSKVLLSFAKCVLQMACMVSKEYRIDEIILCGPEILSTILDSTYEGICVKAVCLPHREFVRLLSKTKYVAIVPGLTSIYETFALGCRTLLLPPTNYSQILQLNAVKNKQLDGDLICDESFEDLISVCEKEGEIETTKILIERIAQELKSNQLEKVLKTGFHNLLGSYDAGITKKRKEYIHAMGKDGVSRVIQSIKAILSKAK